MKPRTSLVSSLLLIILGLLAGYTFEHVRQFRVRTAANERQENVTSNKVEQASVRKLVRHAADTSKAAQRFSETVFTNQLSAILKMPQRKRWQELRDLARSIFPSDATRALGLAEKAMPRNEYWNFRWSLLERWAEQDHASVLTYAQSLKNRQERTMAISSALTEWARQDPDAALAYVEKLPKGFDRQQYYSATLRGLGEASPQKATEMLNKAPMYERRW